MSHYLDHVDLEWHVETEHDFQEVPDRIIVRDIDETPVYQLEQEIVVARDIDDIIVERSDACSKCEECDFAGNVDDITKHKNEKHEGFFLCDECGQIFSEVNLMDIHIKSIHKTIEPFPCKICNLVLGSFKLLEDHMKQVHTSEQQSCEYCCFRSASKEEFQSHIIEKHPNIVILHTAGSQVNDLTEKFVELETLNVQQAKVIQTLLENQNIMKQELFLIRNVLAMQQTTSAPDKEPRVPQPTPPPRPAPSSTSRPQSQSKTNHFDQERKTLFVGDSVSNTVRIDALEKGIKTKITRAKAYASIHDVVSNVAKKAAKIPEANFSKIIPEKLQNDAFENLIVQAGSVDITNLKTNVQPSEHTEYFKQEAVISAKNLFSVVENSARSYPNLKKIVIMKQTPRYDPPIMDPLSLKPVLSELYNKTLEECLQSSQLKDRIILGTHNIDCTGSIREARYRETKSGRFDGLHLYGSSGGKAYTNSVLNILRSAGMVDPDYDHSNCQQTRYQARNRKHMKNYYWENDVDVRRAEFGKNLVDQQNTKYVIPTQNRFASLPDNFQGKY